MSEILENKVLEEIDPEMSVEHLPIPEPYKVYVKLNENNCIISVNSSMWLTDITDWVQIDEGYEYPKYPHAQGNYFEGGIFTSDYFYKYKYVDGEVIERTEEEIQIDRDNVPPSPPTEMEVLQEEVTSLQLALCEQYETNLQLEEEVTNTQLALVELYEGGIA